MGNADEIEFCNFKSIMRGKLSNTSNSFRKDRLLRKPYLGGSIAFKSGGAVTEDEQVRVTKKRRKRRKGTRRSQRKIGRTRTRKKNKNKNNKKKSENQRRKKIKKYE